MKEDKSHILDEQRLKDFHSNLINSGNFDEVYAGTQEQFIAFIDGQEDNLLKFRNNAISDGKVKANQFGGGEEHFLSQFTVKKKGVSDISSQKSEPQFELDKPPTKTTKADAPTAFDYKLLNPNKITDFTQEVGSDHAASMRYNALYGEKYGDDVVYELDEKSRERTHNISNDIANAKATMQFGSNGENAKKSMKDLEFRLMKKYDISKKKIGSGGYGSRKLGKEIRSQISESFTDEFIYDFNRNLEAQSTTPYNALVSNPEIYTAWKKAARKLTFGEVIDNVDSYVQQLYTESVLDNEYQFHTFPQMKELMKSHDLTQDEALSRIASQNEVGQREHLMANIYKKQWDRYELQKEIDELEAENSVKNRNQIYLKQKEMEGLGDALYDINGKRIVLPENKEQAEDERLVNERIDYFRKTIPNVKESVRDLHNDHWNVYQNIIREYEKAKDGYHYMSKQTVLPGASFEEKDKRNVAKRKMDYLSELVRTAKLDVDATGRMLYMNENIALNKYKGMKTKEFFDSWASFNKTIFSNPTKDKSTPFQRMEVFMTAMDHIGIDPSSEEWAGFEESKKGMEMVRNGAFFVDLGVKMWGLNKVAAVSGVTKAVQVIGSNAKLWTIGQIAPKGVEAGKRVQFTAKNLGRLTEHAVMAGYEGTQFELIAGDFTTGAMFYGSNQMLNGVMPKVIGGNRKLGMFLSTMMRSSMSMTASMEAVGTTHAIVDSWIHDKNISLELEKTWGVESEWEKRILMNLALSTFMGIPEMAKQGRRGLLPTNAEKVAEIGERLMKEGKYELAEELGNIRTGLTGTNLNGELGAAYAAKYEYLIKEGVPAKELDRSRSKEAGRDFDFAEIDRQFNERVGEDFALWDHILGKGANETVKAKGRVLQKLGIPVKGKGLGSIESTYHQYRYGEGATKWGSKVNRESKKEDIRIRKEKVREIDKKLKEDLTENSVTDRLTESPEATEEIIKNKNDHRSEVEKEFILSQRRGNEKNSTKTIDKLSNDYSHEVTEGNWSGGAAGDKMGESIKAAKDILRIMDAIGIQKGKRTKIENLIKKLKGHIKAKEAISGKEYKAINDKIKAQSQSFSSEVLTKAIEKAIDKNLPSKRRKKGEKTGMSHRQGFLMDAFDAMFNKIDIERQIKEVATDGRVPKDKKQEKIDKLTRRLKKFEMTERQAQITTDILKGKEDIIKQFEEAGGKEISADLRKQVEEGTANPDVYQAVVDAMANSKNRESVQNRKNELKKKGREEGLSESEIMEYDLLSVYDKSTMSQNQLADAHKRVQRMVTEGRSAYKSEKLYEDMQRLTTHVEFVRDIAHKAADIETMKVDPTAVKEIPNIIKPYMKGRMFIESFTTMMEYMMKKTPGREPLTGAGYRHVEGLIKANTGKNQAVHHHINEVLSMMTSVFGSTKNAQRFMHDAGLGNKKAKKHVFQITSFGSKTNTEMTVGEAMTLYSYMKQPDQLMHLESNLGYDISKKGKLEGQSIKELEAQLEGYAGKEATQWVDAVVEGVMPKIWHQVNEQFKKDKRVDLENLERFFPIFKYASGKNIDLVGDPQNPTPIDFIRDATTSNLKIRRGKGDYNLKDFNDVLFEYIDNSMHYVHYQDVVSDMNNMFKNGAVREVMEKRFSKMSTTVIDRLIQDLAVGHTTGDKIEWMNSARRGFAKAKLGINPTLFPKQMMSVNAFASEMSAGEAVRHLGYTATPNFEVIGMLMKLPEIQARYRMNDFNRDVAEQAAQTDRMLRQGGGDKLKLIHGKGAEMFTWKNMSDNSLIATKWGDLSAILIGGQAMYRTKFDTYTKQGFDANVAKKMALKDFVKATEKTQQSGAIHNLSHLQRMGSYGKMFTLFQNTPLQYARIEMGALSDMKNAMVGFTRSGSKGDLAKLGNSTKTFMVYHFILPELFRAASSGFYLGDSDKTFMDDPKMYMSLLLGSMSYTPILGAAALSAASHLNEGFSFGTGGTIIADMLEESDGILEFIADKALQAGDPAGLTLEFEDIVKVINGFSQWKGIPTAGVATWGKGVYDYLTDRTDDELALLGYSKNIYQGYMLSPDADIINMNLPHNGGTIDTFVDQYIDDNRLGKFEKNKSRLIREYRMYNYYGMNNSNVNFAYRGARSTHEKALFLFKIFQAEVLDKHKLRQNYNLNALKSDLHKGIEKTYPEFQAMIDDMISHGVFSESVYEDLILMIEMPEEEYKKIFEFL